MSSMIIISPAKRQDVACDIPAQTSPVFAQQTDTLLSHLLTLDELQLAQMLKISPSLAKDAYVHLREVGHVTPMPALYLYQGDVYKHLAPKDLTQPEIEYLQGSLRIISAMYGILRPLDGICPYRLEMTSRLEQVPSLPGFWQEHLANWAKSNVPSVVFNLASEAYASALPLPGECRRIDIVFQDKGKDGQYRVIAVKAKRMRGKILRYMAQNQVTDPAQLLSFSQDGYVFDEQESSPSRLVFRSR